MTRNLAVVVATIILMPCMRSQAQDVAAKPETPADAAVAAPTRRIPDTLMFSIDELNDIQSRIGATEEENARERSNAIEGATLYLSTILYTSPTEWTIWVNGKPISPGQDFQEFEIVDIGPRFVELRVPLSAQGMRPVRLEPNQTFVASSGAVVEGAWRR